MTNQPSANDVLMGGGGVPSAKFPNPGDTISGRILAPPSVYQERDYDPNNPGGGALKTYPSGDPIMSIYVDLATDLRDPTIDGDDGTRRLFIEGRYLKGDVRDAVRNAGAAGLEPGGVITVSFTHREDPQDKRSRKYWQAAYQSAGNAALMAGAPVQAPAPVQQTVAAQVMQAAAPAPVQQAPAPVQQPAPVAAPIAVPQAPAPAAAPAAAPDAGTLARQLIAVGLDDTSIAAATGLTPDVIGIIRAA
ncbi:hypothetical protein [Sanguibacter sp. HDW7]|uniref:hypothetical protein n=1 Tax=Sanguibacter sp. HDW7 TaxID=2714931 RepID=UPI00140D922D|nr:hypothetical protein [Sanguibacter sp. HDW7]